MLDASGRDPSGCSQSATTDSDLSLPTQMTFSSPSRGCTADNIREAGWGWREPSGSLSSTAAVSGQNRYPVKGRHFGSACPFRNELPENPESGFATGQKAKTQ